MLHDTDRHQFNDTTADKVDLSNVVPIRADDAQDQQLAPVKTRKPPKPGPVQRRPDEPHRIPLNIGLQATDKMKMLRVIARDNRLTVAQKVVAIPLVDNVNSEVGHSFISWDALGSESGLGWQAAKGAADRLKELGYVNIDHIQGGVVHMSLNLDKIHTPKPERKRTLSRDEAREKAAAKKAGKEMFDQTSPSQRHDMPEATGASGTSYQSQRHVDPVEMSSQTSPGMYGQTSGEVYDGTSEEMCGQTSKSEIPLGDVIQRSQFGESQESNEGCAAAPPPDRPCEASPYEPAGKFRMWIPQEELADAYERVAGAFLGNLSVRKESRYKDHKFALRRVLMQGFSVEQILQRMKPYNDRLLSMPEGKQHFLSFLSSEFDFSGRRQQRWDAMSEAGSKEAAVVDVPF